MVDVPSPFLHFFFILLFFPFVYVCRWNVRRRQKEIKTKNSTNMKIHYKCQWQAHQCKEMWEQNRDEQKKKRETIRIEQKWQPENVQKNTIISNTKQMPSLVSDLCLICFFFTIRSCIYSSVHYETLFSFSTSVCLSSLLLLFFRFFCTSLPCYLIFICFSRRHRAKIKMHKNSYSFYLNLCIIFSIF